MNTYMLPAQERCQGILDLIDQKQYFGIHAARQSGKTTLLKELTNQFNAGEQYYALYCSLESVQKISEPERGIPAVMRVLATQIRFSKPLRGRPFAERSRYGDFNTVVRESLSFFCEELDKPLVVFFDEVDCLSNGTLIAFWRQLRDGYVNRPEIPFVHSLALVGMRNIRDYKGKICEERQTPRHSRPV